MGARNYAVEIVGVTPLLMHHDNVEWADFMKRWLENPKNKEKSKAGDDRSPAWTWTGYLYTDGGRVVIPSDNLMTVLREGGAKCPTGKGKGTFKRQTQSGLVVNEPAWPLIVHGREISSDIVARLREVEVFEEHSVAALEQGFSLFVKRARVGQSKHIRVRPRFDTWSAAGSVTVFDDTITTAVLQDVLTYGGAYAGVGDWRPSSPKSPGPFGKFTATVVEVK